MSDIEFGVDVAGVALSAISVVVPTILASIFYVMIAAAPGGIQYGNSGQCKLLRKKASNNRTNHVNNHGSEAVETEEVIEEVLEEEPAPEVEAEVEEEEVVEVPAEPAEYKKKKNKKKNAPVREEEPVVEEPVVEEPVEEVVEEVVEAPQKKKKNKKSKAAAPAPEAVVEVEEEAAVEVVEEPVEATAEEPAAEEIIEAVAEDEAEEAAEEAQEEAQEKSKKKRNRKPKTSKAFLLAQSFRKGEEEAAANNDDGEWETYQEEDWAVVKKELPKKDKKESTKAEPAAEAAEPPEVGVDEPYVEEEPAEEVPEEEVVEETAEAEEEEQQEEEAAEAEVEAEAEAEEAADEEEEVAEEEDEEEEEEEAAEDDENADGVDTIDVPYPKRRNVGMLRKLIQDKTGVQPLVEIGGEYTIKGPKSGRKQALQAISDIVNKGYTLLSYDDPAEKAMPVQAGSTGALIGPKGSVINKIRNEFNVEIKLPEQSPSVKKSDMVEAYVAGNAAQVEEALRVMNEILEVGFSPVTHPGIVRESMNVDQFEKPFVIGKKGAEIKKIKEQFNVKVDIPTDSDVMTIMGQKGDVKMAKEHVRMVLDTVEDKIQKKREEAEKAAAAAAEAEAEAAREAEEANAKAMEDHDVGGDDDGGEDETGDDEEEESL